MTVDARPRIAAPIRFVLAMMRLYAGIESQFGKAVLDILRKQYPDQEITDSAASVGGKLMGIARKQLQGNETDAMDAVQNLLTYLSTGSTYETDDRGVIKRDEDGEAIRRTTSKPWDFRKDFDTWQEALRAIFSNLRTTAMSGSMSKMERKKKERSVDDAFGTRGEEGGDKSGGEGRMPTPDDTALGKALDDHAAVREFYGVIEDYLPDLRASLPKEELVLFDHIFEDDEFSGSFGSDIKENMGQATALKEKMQEQYPEWVAKNEKRWSGAVGDLRKRLLDSIWKFIDSHMTPADYDTLKETFFADVDPSAVRKKEKDKDKGKADYQKGIDERKVARLKAKADGEGGLTDSEKKELERLSKKLKDSGVDVDAIKPDAGAGANRKKPAAAASSGSRPRILASDLAW